MTIWISIALQAVSVRFFFSYFIGTANILYTFYQGKHDKCILFFPYKSNILKYHIAPSIKHRTCEIIKTPSLQQH